MKWTTKDFLENKVAIYFDRQSIIEVEKFLDEHLCPARSYLSVNYESGYVVPSTICPSCFRVIEIGENFTSSGKLKVPNTPKGKMYEVVSYQNFISESDPVNHPAHYTTGKIEVIDFIEDQQLGFHLANAMKYICRSAHKGTEKQDLEKAVWYLQRKISKL